MQARRKVAMRRARSAPSAAAVTNGFPGITTPSIPIKCAHSITAAASRCLGSSECGGGGSRVDECGGGIVLM